MDKFKGQSLENVLRQQIEKGEYYDNSGGGGSKPPIGGDGGSSDESSEPEEESYAEMLDETLQVIFATSGFIFVVLSLSVSLSHVHTHVHACLCVCHRCANKNEIVSHPR